LASVVLCLITASLIAQPADQPSVRLGILGGLNIATIVKTNDPNFQSDPLFGFNGGALLQIPFGRIIAIEPEVLYSQKGYKSTEAI
jgi:hypothetical protein